jgi:hypothetical protein
MSYIDELTKKRDVVVLDELDEEQLMELAQEAAREVDSLRARISGLYGQLEDARNNHASDVEIYRDQLASAFLAAEGDKALLDGFEKIRSDDVESHQISEDEFSHELRGHYWTTISVESCDVRVAIQSTIDNSVRPAP